jgi:ABC-2 type transport system permease protein
VRRDAILYFSYRTQAATQAFSLLFTLTLFYYIARLLHSNTLGGSGGYFAYVVVGLVILQALVTTLESIPASVRQELVAGTLERFLVSRFGAFNGVVAMTLFPALRAFVSGALMLVLATAIFGLHIAATAPLAIPVAMLGTISFAPLALLMAGVVVMFKQASSGARFVIAGLSIAGGLYFPASLLPVWARWTAQVQPFTPAADSLRHLLVGSKLQYSMSADLIKMAAFGAVLLPLSAWLLTHAITYAQRRGTIIEY